MSDQTNDVQTSARPELRMVSIPRLKMWLIAHGWSFAGFTSDPHGEFWRKNFGRRKREILLTTNEASPFYDDVLSKSMLLVATWEGVGLRRLVRES